MSDLEHGSIPVLSCEEARQFESRLFGDNEEREWHAMLSAGTGVGRQIQGDYREMGGFPDDGRILVLVGKGHNGGDALIAARWLLDAYPRATADIVFCFGSRRLRPLAKRAWLELQQSTRDRIAVFPSESLLTPPSARSPYSLSIDGLFGFQFRPPADEQTVALIEAVNALSIRCRVAVDLPSADLLRADFTYATGSVKAPVLTSEIAGRVRYVDLGFFARDDSPVITRPGSGEAPDDRVITTSILEPLRNLRSARSDKRTYGHVFIVGGSRGYPGAVLMGAMAAVRSGAGLVTVFAPESLTPSFAARLPEAIWVPWPETPAGTLALEGEHLLRERAKRADSIVVGPGMGREPETLALAQSIAGSAGVPLVIDADALQRDIVTAGKTARVITPHAGEFERIASGADLRSIARDPKLTVVLKGPITRLCNGGPVYHALCGGPVLARGGSGDLLAGMIGTQLAQWPGDPTDAAARAVLWHGAAADHLARAQGQVAVATTQLLDFLGPALWL